MGFTIRAATSDDWAAIWPMLAATVAAGETLAAPVDLTSAGGRTYWWRVEPGATVVAIVDDHGSDEVVGTATMGPNRQGRGDHVGTGSFLVAPSARGRGVGRRLGEHVVAWHRSRGFRSIQFNAVVETNTAAVELWSSLGFSVVGTVPAAFRSRRHGAVGLHVMHVDLGTDPGGSGRTGPDGRRTDTVDGTRIGSGGAPRAYRVAVPDRYLTFSRDDWAALRAATPMTLRQDDLDSLQGINERIDIDEVTAIYLPLSRLLNLYVSAVQDLQRVSATFLGSMAPKVPYVIGVAGSVAVGKSTFARILQALLSRWPNHPQVDLVTTDGFLQPNAVLDARGIMDRKGFPESYDTRALLGFLRSVKSGALEVSAPVYDHVAYDILDGESVVVRRPDIVIVEGLNVLQVDREGTEFVSDYFDFSIYVDAAEADIEEWYVQRFFALRRSVFRDPGSYFRNYADLDDEQAETTARHIWHTINGRNLRENIAPTRDRASLIIRKERDHRVSRVTLRKL